MHESCVLLMNKEVGYQQNDKSLEDTGAEMAYMLKFLADFKVRLDGPQTPTYAEQNVIGQHANGQ